MLQALSSFIVVKDGQGSIFIDSYDNLYRCLPGWSRQLAPAKSASFTRYDVRTLIFQWISICSRTSMFVSLWSLGWRIKSLLLLFIPLSFLLLQIVIVNCRLYYCFTNSIIVSPIAYCDRQLSTPLEVWSENTIFRFKSFLLVSHGVMVITYFFYGFFRD